MAHCGNMANLTVEKDKILAEKKSLELIMRQKDAELAR